MRSHVKSLERSNAVLECGALQEIGPHGVDHREQNGGQWHNLSSVSLFNSIRVLFYSTIRARLSWSLAKYTRSTLSVWFLTFLKTRTFCVSWSWSVNRSFCYFKLLCDMLIFVLIYVYIVLSTKYHEIVVMDIARRPFFDAIKATVREDCCEQVDFRGFRVKHWTEFKEKKWLICCNWLFNHILSFQLLKCKYTYVFF